MKKFVELRAKTYICLVVDGSKDEKSNRHKKGCHKK